MDEKKSVLDLLEQEFINEQQEKDKKKRKFDIGSVRRVIKRRNILIILLLLLIAAMALFAGYLLKDHDIQSGITSKPPSFLTEEELEKWNSKDVDNDQIFVYVNTILVADEEQNVELRLVNPPYSAYPLRITIESSAEEPEVYYESDILEPGQSMEKAKLDKVPEEAGEYDVTIRYEFYDSELPDVVVGEHTVSAVMIIN